MLGAELRHQRVDAAITAGAHRQRQRQEARRLRVCPLVEQQANHVLVAQQCGFGQRGRAVVQTRRLLRGVRSVVEQVRDDVEVSTDRARCQNGLSPIRGDGVDVSPMLDERARLLQVVHRPHQSGRPGVVGDVGIGARIEQFPHERRVTVEGSRHERRRAAGSAHSRQAGVAAHGVEKRRAMSCTERVEGAHRQLVERHRGCLAGRAVGPLGALINPALDDVDLGGREPAFERHLTPEPRADQAQVETAGFRGTRRDDRDGAADERVTTPVQPVAVRLFLGTVALVAVLAEDGLDVALKIYAVFRPRA